MDLMNEIDKLAFAIADTISGAFDDIDADELCSDGTYRNGRFRDPLQRV